MLNLIDARLTDTGTVNPTYVEGQEMWVKDSSGRKQQWIYLQNKTGGSVSAAGHAKVGLQTATPYLVALALADLAAPERIIVPGATIAANYYGWWQFQGYCTLTVANGAYTAGHGLKVHDGIIKTTGGAWANGDIEFGIIVVGGGAVTSLTVYLQGRESLGTT